MNTKSVHDEMASYFALENINKEWRIEMSFLESSILKFKHFRMKSYLRKVPNWKNDNNQIGKFILYFNRVSHCKFTPDGKPFPCLTELKNYIKQVDNLKKKNYNIQLPNNTENQHDIVQFTI
jgi:hypothetical protein